MKYFIVLSLLFIFGCNGDTLGERQAALDMLNQMKPLSATDQSLAIKECEKNEGWTAMPVTYREITLQIRCIQK